MYLFYNLPKQPRRTDGAVFTALLGFASLCKSDLGDSDEMRVGSLKDKLKPTPFPPVVLNPFIKYS